MMDTDLSGDDKIRHDLYTLCYDGLYAQELNYEELHSKLSQLQELSHEFGSILFDVLHSLDSAVEGDAILKERFNKIIENSLKKFLDRDLLENSLESLQDDDSVSKAVIRLKTRLFYKQLKFNLLREESEGFSKLICELCYDENECSAESALERIRCLIGQFNLDPNRVLDLLLECFEYNMHRKQFYLDLLKLLNSSKRDVGHLLGFKFTSYQKKYDAKDTCAPDSLYILAATLIQHNMLELLHICSYLCPTQDSTWSLHKSLLGPAEMRCKQMVTNTKLAQEDISIKAALAPAPFKAGTDGPLEPLQELEIGTNQKLGLLWGLLETNNWKDARFFLERLPDFYATRSYRVAKSMIELVEHSILWFYHEKCKGSGLETKQDIAESDLVYDWQSLADYALVIARYLGPSLALRPVTLTRIVRLFAEFMKEYGESKAVGEEREKLEKLHNLFIDVCDEVLITSMTALQPGNVAFSEELWAYISQLPYTVRYRFYGRWKMMHTSMHPILILRKGQMMGRARYVMKRLSKDTTKLCGRQLGKMTHCHPTVVFDIILNQLQTFDNFIAPVVDSMKVISSMEFDVLSYCIIDHLSDPQKQKLKVSDAMLSPWLQSLATFVGLVFRKNSMELTGVLQYVANQLKSGTSLDLLVLREIIENMSGIETTSQLTQDQLEALAGGDLLRQEGGYLGVVRNMKRTSSRLKEALLQEDLTVGLCILMAQQRSCIVYKEGQEMIHLKLLGQVYDQCQDTLVQFGSFLFTNIKMDDYTKRMPMAQDLISTYHLTCDSAFFLTRPIYSYQINSKFEHKKKKEKAKESKEAKEAKEKREKGEETPVNLRINDAKKIQFYIESSDEVMEPLSAALLPLFAADTWKDINPRLLATFWSLTMNDIHVPENSYSRELEKIQKAIVDADNSKELSDSKRRKEKDRLDSLYRKLDDEEGKQREHVARVMARLDHEKNNWFPTDVKDKPAGKTVVTLLQHCIMPRSCFSDLDALFCAKFLLYIQCEHVPGFVFVKLLDKMFVDLNVRLKSLSENESHYFGRFLNYMLERMLKWLQDEKLFIKECYKSPGFNNIKMGGQKDLEHGGYKTLFGRWHHHIARQLSVVFLFGKDYVMTRNTLIVLMKILPSFPIFTSHGAMFEKVVGQVQEREKDVRPDLHLLASSYWGQMKMKKDKSKMLDYQPIPQVMRTHDAKLKRVIDNKVTQQILKAVAPAKSAASSTRKSATPSPATKAAAANPPASHKLHLSNASKTVKTTPAPEKSAVKRVITTVPPATKASANSTTTTTASAKPSTATSSAKKPSSVASIPQKSGTTAPTPQKSSATAPNPQKSTAPTPPKSAAAASNSASTKVTSAEKTSTPTEKAKEPKPETQPAKGKPHIKREHPTPPKPSPEVSTNAAPAAAIARHVESPAVKEPQVKKEPKETVTSPPPAKKGRVVSTTSPDEPPQTSKRTVVSPADESVSRKRTVVESANGHNDHDQPPPKRTPSTSTAAAPATKSRASDTLNGEGVARRRPERKTSPSPDTKKLREDIGLARKHVANATREAENTLKDDGKGKEGRTRDRDSESSGRPASRNSIEKEHKHKRITASVDDEKASSTRHKQNKKERDKPEKIVAKAERRSRTPSEKIKKKSKEREDRKYRKRSLD